MRSKKRILHFPGLHYIITNDNPEESPKVRELSRHFEVNIIDYRALVTGQAIVELEKADGFTGSSFGGFFAMFLGLSMRKPSVAVNPSIFLPERLGELRREHPGALSLVNEQLLTTVRENGLAMPGRQGVMVLLNDDDETLPAEESAAFCEKHGIRHRRFATGSHAADNFARDMIPIIVQVISSTS